MGRRGTRQPGLRARILVLAGILVGAFLSATSPAFAADPPSGTLTKTKEVTWTGGPFTGSNPAVCAGPSDPSCDHFHLTIDSSVAAGDGILVAIDGANESDDYDLFVFYPDGSLAGSKATSSGDEAVVVEHRTDKGTGPYEIRVQPFLVTPGSTYQGLADRTRDDPVDPEPEECLEPVPDSASVSGVTDDGATVSLETVVLLDGVRRERANEIIAKAVEAYAGVNTRLNVVDIRPVGFKGDNADSLIQQAKNLYGGQRPAGSDLVYVLTSEDIQLPGLGTAVAGLADCIGGVRYPNRAFAVGEEFSELEQTMIGPFATRRFGGARIMAHELGHLMGAHHHYANCVEGIPSDFDPFAPSPCTLMFNSVSFGSINFSTLNTTVVRGHAVNYARP
jgi:hypothetical protein